MNESLLQRIREELEDSEARFLSGHAVRNTDALRRRPEHLLASDYRFHFAVDADRILHSRAYTRYIDKTQVFYLVKNDHITHRVLHVQLVSKIARTVGRFLGLNQDLIEAVALGHDIGHAPFGHDGERFLSELCFRSGIGHFHHNVQSVQFLEHVERKGKGWNLCLQTLDGILGHDGEVHDQTLRPTPDKTFETLEWELEAKKKASSLRLTPMTLEGCVVRLADTVSYIGRDIEDAIRLDVIRRSDIPTFCVEILGNTNGTIVHRLVTDLIANSRGRDFVGFGPEVSEALAKLKAFNLERIYLNPKIKPYSGRLRRMFETLFQRYCEDVARDRRESVIFSQFLEDKSERYLEHHSIEEKVRDFIAGMTDRYFLRQFPESERPAPILS
ncbi:MAG: HD domain-containing protein [Desulfobacteraceae bacterium]|nr:HD domain-containing protein [Desulfobacteraceae bacterium]